ncbi:hypothetical protein ACXR2T_00255 [Leucobacter sp. HY1910]
MSRNTLILTAVISSLTMGLTGCALASETGGEPSGATPNLAVPEHSASKPYGLSVQSAGNFKVITFDPDAMPSGQAVFEGDLTANEQGCVSLETAAGATPLAFSAATFERISDDGQLEIEGKLHKIGEAVSVMGGSKQVSEESLAECGEVAEVTFVSTLSFP